MARKLSGGCACGAIHYECNVDPAIMLNCHCRDCQRASGSAYAAVVVVPKAAVQMRGEPRYHKIVGKAGKAADSGRSRPLFRDDAAHPFRDDLAHRSEMMSPTIPG
jgi:Glutathione-dependent formaldehyde-activating enzyme